MPYVKAQKPRTGVYCPAGIVGTIARIGENRTAMIRSLGNAVEALRFSVDVSLGIRTQVELENSLIAKPKN